MINPRSRCGKQTFDDDIQDRLLITEQMAAHTPMAKLFGPLDKLYSTTFDVQQ
jgi:hypothetical protein